MLADNEIATNSLMTSDENKHMMWYHGYTL